MTIDRMTQVALGSQFETSVQQNSGPENVWSSIAFIWRRKFLIMCMMLLGLALGYLYFVKKTPEYESKAQVLVVAGNRASLTDANGTPMETAYDRTRIELAMSPVVLEKAVEIGNLGELMSFAGESDVVGEILSNLEVEGNVSEERPGETSDVLTMTYRSRFAGDCPKVLEAIHLAFTQFMNETYDSIHRETEQLITRAKDDLTAELKRLETDYNTFRTNSQLLRQGEAAHNVHDERLAQIESVRSAAQVENAGLQARREAIEAALKLDNRVDALRMLIDDIEGASASRLQYAVDAEAKLLPMLVEEQRLLENYGEAHPKVIAIRNEIELTRDHMKGLAESQPFDPDNPLALFDAYLRSLDERININDTTIAKMDELYAMEQQKSKALLQDQLQEENYRSEIARTERMFDAVVKRLEEINLVRDSGKVTTKLIFPPSIGGQVAPDPLITFTFAGTVGMLMGLGLAYVLDVSDRRFKSPDEIHHTLGIPVMGHIPEIAVEAVNHKRAPARQEIPFFDESLPTIHAPKSRVSEAYRGVRTGLYFGTRGRGNQVIQITSPNPGDGKTTVSTNLAISIAQSGKRVLLIDADFRRPRVHSLFQLHPERGLSSVMTGETEIEDATQEGPVKNLYLMPCGPRPDNPSELLSSPRFDELLQVVREKYDFVIIDAPPILAVTDPLTLASRVDGVLLVIRLTKHARGLAARAISELTSMNGKVLGVIVNAFGTPGFGYGNYRTGFGANGHHYIYGPYGYDYEYDEEYDERQTSVAVARRNGRA